MHVIHSAYFGSSLCIRTVTLLSYGVLVERPDTLIRVALHLKGFGSSLKHCPLHFLVINTFKEPISCYLVTEVLWCVRIRYPHARQHIRTHTHAHTHTVINIVFVFFIISQVVLHRQYTLRVELTRSALIYQHHLKRLT